MSNKIYQISVAEIVPMRGLVQGLVSQHAQRIAQGKGDILRRAISNHLGIKDVSMYDMAGIEIVKRENEEWLLHQGKSFGHFKNEVKYSTEPPFKVTETLTFYTGNDPQFDLYYARNIQQGNTDTPNTSGAGN